MTKSFSLTSGMLEGINNFRNNVQSGEMGTPGKPEGWRLLIAEIGYIVTAIFAFIEIFVAVGISCFVQDPEGIYWVKGAGETFGKSFFMIIANVPKACIEASGSAPNMQSQL